ncbi:hypothetical protein MTO96_014392 [Rhipicephalus appendiculatus]
MEARLRDADFHFLEFRVCSLRRPLPVSPPFPETVPVLAPKVSQRQPPLKCDDCAAMSPRVDPSSDLLAETSNDWFEA